MVAAVSSILGSVVVDVYGFYYLFVFMFIASLLGTIASSLLFRDREYPFATTLRTDAGSNIH